MKAHEDKAIERLVRKVMQDTELKSPSEDFTSQIMSQIEAIESNTITTYKPLISKRVWSVIGFAILAISVYLFIITPSNETSWFSHVNFESLTNNSIIHTVSSFKMSKTLMYALVFLSIMICVQIPLLKNHFDKRFEV
ncbi:hypothetical protein ACFS5M_06165 [Lacinutrix iliipiscaria]|uniref:Uncharacterized protein n=1 Tax=Lacinutrix iliipiscaria TaxID=1230532 RepID=A0ABW5WLZ2_9FLAO